MRYGILSVRGGIFILESPVRRLSEWNAGDSLLRMDQTMKNKNSKSRAAQVHVRLTPEEKKTIEAAAEKDRRTLSEYLVVAGLERARK